MRSCNGRSNAFISRLWAIAFLTLVGLSVAGKDVADPPPAGNWPQWRGVRRDNVSDDRDLLKDWPADGPRLGWEAKGLGPGYAGVSVAVGRVYTMGDAEDGCYVIALDEATGDRLWAAKVGPPGDGGGYPGPRSTPTVDPADGKHLYAPGSTGTSSVWRSTAAKRSGTSR